MNITLPQWKSGFKDRITEQAYGKLLAESQALLNRALQIYEGYLNTGNEVLYEVYNDVLKKLCPKFKLLSMLDWSSMEEIAVRLNCAAEASVIDERQLKATFLFDLVAVIREYKETKNE